MFELQWPWMLLLLPLPLLLIRIRKPVQRQQAAIWVPFFDRLQQLDRDKTVLPPISNRLFTVSALLLWLCLVFAASRPQFVGEAVQLPATGRDLLLAVDISGSMDTRDMTLNGDRVNRLKLVKSVVHDFVQRREGDRLGLLLFGSQAYLQAPLTFDRQTVGTLLNEARLGFAGPYTAIGDSIGLAIKRLQSRPENARILILLTDGSNTAGEVDPIKAAQLAASQQVKIYTIGVGAEEMKVRSLIWTETVNPSEDLDEETLKAIADITGGQYFRARNETELNQIYQTLDQLEPVEQQAETFRPSKSLFHYPLAIALILSMIMALSRLLPGLQPQSTQLNSPPHNAPSRQNAPPPQNAPSQDNPTRRSSHAS